MERKVRWREEGADSAIFVPENMEPGPLPQPPRHAKEETPPPETPRPVTDKRKSESVAQGGFFNETVKD